ncbi:MAG TPA: glycosyltransferase [Flavisolibacter sp.]|nr:glycosyltransferase [Flavisolibacter sp.]
MLLLFTTISLLGLYGALLLYYLYHWKKAAVFHPPPATSFPFLSVVIAARNEENTLPLLVQSLTQQDYPRNAFEVIIVNDHSTDGTASLAATLPQGFRMILPDTSAEQSSKKKAIASGVRAAKGDLIVVTDADCIVSTQWLATIACFQQETGAQFIAAPVKFTYTSSLIQVFQALDFLVLQGLTAASVSARFHSMANGANLAYTKEAYTKVNGFEGIDAVASGDDMLLMYKIWQQQPKGVWYLKSKEAIVSTAPMPNWQAFINQRRRWASKTLYYDDKKVMAVAVLVYSVNVWFILLLITSFFNSNYGWLLLAYLFGKLVLELPFVYSVARFYKEQRLLWYFPLFQPLHILYTISVGFLSQLGGFEWKGRQTK